MKSLKTYLPSLILSILLVFTTLAASAVTVAIKYADSERLVQIAEQNEIIPKIQDELENYFKKKYNETGVPAEVYMESLSEEYIHTSVEKYIKDGFAALEGGPYPTDTTPNFMAPKNEQLETGIEAFFSDYAEKNGYEKDENYSNKLDSAIASAYGVIGEYCDIYKLRTMNDEGILQKFSGIYNLIGVGYAAVLIAIGVILLILLLINLKQLRVWLYWVATASFVAGFIGTIPGIYFSTSNYFDGFVIKQPHIFTSFTKLMYGAVDSFLINQVIMIAAGIVLITIFAVIPKKTKEE